MRERTQKAQGAVRYMEKYSAKKNTMQNESSRLRARIQRDRMELIKHNKKLSAAHERNKKHDELVKNNMKSAINAMKKVNTLTGGVVLPDPTVTIAKKKALQAHGKEVFSVLGLDRKQLGKAQEKLSKTIETTKERMTKERKLKLKANNERNAKRHRSEKNHKFYATKWAEKKAELARKKSARDKFVNKLKKKEKHQKWVKRRNEDEKAKKKAIVDARMRKIKAKKLAKQKLHAAKYKKKMFIKKQATKKFNTENRKLAKKARIAFRNYGKFKKNMLLSKEKKTKAKATAVQQARNLVFAKSQVKSAAVAFGRANEAKSKSHSELSGKIAIKKGAWMRSRVAAARERGMKVKVAKTKVHVAGKQLATAKIQMKKTKPKWLKATRKSVTYAKTKAAKIAAYSRKMAGHSRRRRSIKKLKKKRL